jgi:galactose mutarotase-like enzyme
MIADVSEYIQDWKVEVIENECLKVCVIPELGAKIVQITDKRAQYEWLWTDASRPLRARVSGDFYDQHDISGFDECFPNIGISHYPNNTNISMPDHGELWSQAWQYQRSEHSVTTSVEGKVLPYTFQRTITLQEDSLLFSYSIENLGLEEFYAFWSAHPLFHAVEGMEIIVNGNPTMTKEFGFSGRMGSDGNDGYEGHLDKYVWPHTLDEAGSTQDISHITYAKALTDKVVLNSPEDGVITLLNHKDQVSVSFILDPEKIPYVGVCFNLNAWPFSGQKGKWLAIEPSFGPTDKLDECQNLGQAPIFTPNHPFNFEFSMVFGYSEGEN